MHPPPCGQNRNIQQVVEESDTSMEEVLPVLEADHMPPHPAAPDQWVNFETWLLLCLLLLLD
jgi:hypothetical protein